MPLPNGVCPDGDITPTCPTAAWLGNRGELHDHHQRLVKKWKRKAWVTCQLAYKGWNRKPLMRSGQYTELFFLDEATALAAGHRPCGMCRKPRYTSFKTHWLRANSMRPDMSIDEMDKLLHAERLNPQTDGDWLNSFSMLPPGVMVYWEQAAHLWDGTSVRRWTPTGYGHPIAPHDLASKVRLVTPPSVVRAVADGYAVQVHASAQSSSYAPD